ncbi:MAG: DUF1801 domain-containing protein [Rhizobiales bacterium]|nr:DUF1801 domain-containing protein [Hyphomicrobiales bacterium]
MAKMDMGDDVAAAFAEFPEQQRESMLQMRALIVQTCEEAPGTGQLVETLKWGQPSYATVRPVTGSPIRLGISKSGQPALYCHCQTTLIQEFRDQFADSFDFEGNRALVLKGDVETSKAELQSCITRALSYKLR